VAWWVRLAQAVAEVHEQGGVLGGISPFSIVTKAEGRAIPPVLTQLTAPLVGATFSPERLKGHAPDPSDDVWALYASLYWALTGVAPFPGNSREGLLKDIASGPPTPLSAFGVREPEFEEIMKRGLTGDASQRAHDINELVKSLDAWERGLQLPPRPKRGAAPRSLSGIVKGGLTPAAQFGRVVFSAATLPTEFLPELPSAAGRQEARISSPHQSPTPLTEHEPVRAQPVAAVDSSPGIEAPPPNPPSVVAPKRPSVNPFARRKSPWPLLLGLVIVAGAAVAFFSINRSSNAEATPAAVGEASAPPEPSASTSSPASLSAPLTPTQSLNACVRSYFADDVFEPAVELDFVCDAGDHREVSTRLHELAEARADAAMQQAQGQAKQKLGAGQREGFQVDTVTGDAGVDRVRRPLGWYELLATAVIKKGCCPSAAPVTLPETTGWCEQMQDVVRDLAEDSGRSGDLAPRVKRFDKAVDCLFANRVRRPYPDEYKNENLTEPNRGAFQQFLSNAAISDAKRRTLR
jgi:hypothetical protein